MELLDEQRRAKAEQIVDEGEQLLSIAAGLLLRKMGSGEHQSISHSGDYAGVAIFSECVGLDIERIPEIIPEVPDYVFTEDELAWLREQPSPERFARLWTALESALKADGCGFEGCEREYSVLERGRPWFIETVLYKGYAISCAAKRKFELCIEELELL